MTHFTDFDIWWSRYNLTFSMEKEAFMKYPFYNGMDKGISIIVPIKPEKLKEGDVIAFKDDNQLITHRLDIIFELNGSYNISTKGDANLVGSDYELFMPIDKYVGKTVFFLPLWIFDKTRNNYPEKCYSFGNKTCIKLCIKDSLHEEKDCADIEEVYKDYCYYGLNMCDKIKNEYVQYDCEMFLWMGDYFDNRSN